MLNIRKREITMKRFSCFSHSCYLCEMLIIMTLSINMEIIGSMRY